MSLTRTAANRRGKESIDWVDTFVDIEAPLGSPEKELRSFGGMME